MEITSPTRDISADTIDFWSGFGFTLCVDSDTGAGATSDHVARRSGATLYAITSETHGMPSFDSRCVMFRYAGPSVATYDLASGSLCFAGEVSTDFVGAFNSVHTALAIIGARAPV